MLFIIFIIWVNKDGNKSFIIIIKYKFISGDILRDISIMILYIISKLAVSSFNIIYKISGDNLE